MISSKKKQTKKTFKKSEPKIHRFFLFYCIMVLFVSVSYISTQFLKRQTGLDSFALSWSLTTVDSSQNRGDYSDIAFNNSNYPIVSYYNTSSTALMYAFYDGASWTTETVDNTATVGLYTSIAWDTANNLPIISYYDQTNSGLRYAVRDGGSPVCTDTDWRCEAVDSTGDVGKNSSIAFIDSSTDKPVIAYHDTTNTDLKYAIRDGGNSGCADSDWTCESVDTESVIADTTTSIVVNSSFIPVILYSHSESGSSWLMYVARDDSDCAVSVTLDADWGCEQVDTDAAGVGYQVRANVNSSNNIEAVFNDPNGVLAYTERTAAATWSAPETITTALNATTVPSITTGPSGLRIVSYMKSSKQYYAEKYTSWTSEEAEPASTGSVSSIGYNSTRNKVYISYQETSNNDLKVAGADGVYNSSPVVGYTADNVIPSAQVTQATDGSGLVTVTFKVKDSETNNTTLNTFEYSVSDGAIGTFNAPTNADNSDSLYKTSLGADDWDTNGATGTYSSGASFAAATGHTFYWYTKHATDLSGLNSVSQTDVQIRFKANDGTTSSSYGTSESFTVDNLSPATSVATNIATRPVAGGTTATLSGSFTETNPNTNQFYAKINGGSYSDATSGTTNTASPSNQATTLLATLDGDDCVTAVKITHTDDYGNAYTNENTSPSLSCATPYTPATPTVSITGPTTLNYRINANSSETGSVQYAVEVVTGDDTVYVQTNGTLGATADWTLSAGSVISITQLQAETTYTFSAKSRNTSDTSVESALSTSAVVTTSSDRRAQVVFETHTVVQTTPAVDNLTQIVAEVPQEISVPTAIEETNNEILIVEDPAPTIKQDRFMNLTVTLNSENQPVLSWKDSKFADPNIIYVYRNYWPERTAFGLVTGVSFGQQYFTDTDVLPGKTYYYRVRAFDIRQNTVISDPVGIKIPVPEDLKSQSILPSVISDFLLEPLLRVLRP